MEPDAPLLHDDMFTAGRRADAEQRRPTSPSAVHFGLGDIEAGFRDAEVVVEGRYTTQPVHQAYIEPHATRGAATAPTGRCLVWSRSQGQFMVRSYCAKLLGIELSNIRVMVAEIGGGFGGKTLVYLEPLALALSKKAGRPVKMVMTREDVFRATGPTSGGIVEVKIGARKDGTITAAAGRAEVPGGRLPGLAGAAGLHDGVRGATTSRTSASPATTWSRTGPRSPPIARRARRSPASAWRARWTISRASWAWTRSSCARRTPRKDGTKAAYGPTFKDIGFVETLEAAKKHPHYSIPLGPNQGRGVASGFWFNIGGESSGACTSPRTAPRW